MWLWLLKKNLINSLRFDLSWSNTYRVPDILPGCGDDREHQEEGCGGAVMQPEDAWVNGDPVRLDQTLEAAENVQHRDLRQLAFYLLFFLGSF